MRYNSPKSHQAAKPQSISFSANPTYHSVSNLMFCGPLVFPPTPRTANLKSRFHDVCWLQHPIAHSEEFHAQSAGNERNFRLLLRSSGGICSNTRLTTKDFWREE